MKKAFFLIFLAFVALFSFGGCTISTSFEQVRKSDIVLSFDSAEAYFVGAVPLYPIAGDDIAEGDLVERVSVTLNSTEPVYLQLKLVYKEEQEDISGLMIMVDGGNAVAVKDGITLYVGAEKEKERTLGIALYLEKNAPYSEAGKSLKFVFELSASDGQAIGE